jgi:integrase
MGASLKPATFHSLRYTFCTSLPCAGVSQLEAQELMRHSDPRLTQQQWNPYGDNVNHRPWDADSIKLALHLAFRRASPWPPFYRPP